ncbi:MAG: hypothetical protein ACJARR_001833 [Pseudophaeobacter arcticus]|jgi:hypothetical protein
MLFLLVAEKSAYIYGVPCDSRGAGFSSLILVLKTKAPMNLKTLGKCISFPGFRQYKTSFLFVCGNQLLSPKA